ncbi:MAG: DUF4238 domain-containing protein [Mesorhizobium sp.]|uniref:DUF4238 domain-containing protein n=1 Tax=unclassified Mesorhizobium TaxID=325217 RepID=UPI000F74EB91|nr:MULTISPECIES: DUF4238 domain-containing protein [unclassified Mesorhizobium]RVC80993.1 DUF4238 domain-containing protein [Mesorhizobium sp. M2A.F.Ca.ET.046.02.1.1]AZO34033.1 DUF4238 domain-containing protein [Mesorhizobium sp. M2A.F.Ca.ET.046.03.2.1]AZO71456.1 DUF4238 domain-containing protein [Mesorhizobium sp. M1D.F.Ca.ET.043.01.1.1]RWB47011.1 MAG: DUF4238 domain-containing protein [Mesorhizobium sp.]RWE20797.1 MAG: DUF4238 domain-containing protein [Mesorhizobium sp.]
MRKEFKQNYPNKHHFLPVFYLKEWAGADGRVVQFSRPRPNDKEVKALRRHPSAVGYINGLYAVEGLPEKVANLFETEFTRPVDTEAAAAMRRLMMGRFDSDATPKEAVAWIKYLLSLMMRMPADIRRLKHYVKHDWFSDLPSLQAAFKRSGMMGNPQTVEDYLRLLGPTFDERAAMIALSGMIQVEAAIKAIGQLQWTASNVYGEREFVTSDRPIIASVGMTGPKAHIILPIGPHRVFIATKTEEFRRHLFDKRPWDFVTAVNKHIVNNATDYVYGSNAAALRFVQKHMGEGREETFLERINKLRMAEIAKPASERVDLDL